jgi:acyl carrier protein
MNDEEILALIKEALRHTVSDRAGEFENLTLDSELHDIALGSLSTMEMISYIEERLVTTFRLQDLARVKRLEDLAVLLRAARPGAPSSPGGG